jgi:hypothetical protein
MVNKVIVKNTEKRTEGLDENALRQLRRHLIGALNVIDKALFKQTTPKKSK